jgi:hypothetical protein
MHKPKVNLVWLAVVINVLSNSHFLLGGGQFRLGVPRVLVLLDDDSGEEVEDDEGHKPVEAHYVGVR